MPSKGAVRALRLPPTDFSARHIPGTHQPARNWYRVHRSVYGGVHFGLRTFHRFSHKHCPFRVVYMAADIATCLFERFGDEAYEQEKAIAHSIWEGCSVSTIWVAELWICDLSNARTLSAMMADLSALMHNDLAAPQEWGLAVQEHPQSFQGIKYRSRFNGKACLALFDRGDAQRRVHEILCEPLSDNDAAVAWLDKHRVSLY